MQLTPSFTYPMTSIKLPCMTVEIGERIVVRADDDQFARGVRARRTCDAVAVAPEVLESLLGFDGACDVARVERYRRGMRRAYKALFCSGHNTQRSRVAGAAIRGYRGRASRRERASRKVVGAAADSDGPDPPIRRRVGLCWPVRDPRPEEANAEKSGGDQ